MLHLTKLVFVLLISSIDLQQGVSVLLLNLLQRLLQSHDLSHEVVLSPLEVFLVQEFVIQLGKQLLLTNRRQHVVAVAWLLNDRARPKIDTAERYLLQTGQAGNFTYRCEGLDHVIAQLKVLQVHLA